MTPAKNEAPGPDGGAATVALPSADAVRAAAEAALLPLPEPPARYAPYATLVTTDRRIIEIAETDAGGLRLTIEGRGTPLELDPFQAGAFKAAIMSLGHLA